MKTAIGTKACRGRFSLRKRGLIEMRASIVNMIYIGLKTLNLPLSIA